VVRPGIYHEVVMIDRRSDLVIQGITDCTFSAGVPCWDAVADGALFVTIDGSIHIVSSQRITVEGLTITGQGPGVRISGTAGRPSESVSIRYCNLLCNEGAAVELSEPYREVSVSCSNACLSDGQMRILGTADAFPHQADVHVTCSLRYSAVAGPDGSPAGQPVIVAIIDSGIDRTIPALGCRMWVNAREIPDNGLDDDSNGYIDDVYGWDFQDEDPDSLSGSPLHWHGTFVAGVLADAVEPEAGLTDEVVDVRIMDLRFLDSDGLFTTSEWVQLVRAIDYALANGADIINMSIYASDQPPRVVRDAVNRAVAAGALVVAIAGNDGGPLGPIASWEEVLTVTAQDREGTVASFANTGEAVDVGALGVGVLSLLPGGELATKEGTSFAAPWIAGLAALHLSENPAISPSALEDWLRTVQDGEGSP